jgi:hypothetical protein
MMSDVMQSNVLHISACKVWRMDYTKLVGPSGVGEVPSQHVVLTVEDVTSGCSDETYFGAWS